MLAWSRDFELQRRDKLWTWRKLNVSLFVSVADRYNSRRYRRPLSFFLLTFNFFCCLLVIIITIVYFATLSQLLELHRIVVQSPPKFQPEIEHKIYQKRFLGLLGCQSLMTVFCIFTPCTVIRSDRRFGRNSCFQLQGDWIWSRSDWEENMYLLHIYRRFQGLRPA